MRLAAGDADRAAALVEDCAMPLIMQSHLTLVRQWLNLLPADLIARRPRLQLVQVWIQFHMSRPQEAARTLKAAKQSIAAQAAAGTIDAAERDALRAELCTLTVGVVSAADRSRTAERLAAGWMKTLPEDKPFFRGTLSNIHAFCCYSLGNMEGARAASLKARDAHAQAQSVFGLVYCDLILGLTEEVERRARPPRIVCSSARWPWHGNPSGPVPMPRRWSRSSRSSCSMNGTSSPPRAPAAYPSPDHRGMRPRRARDGVQAAHRAPCRRPRPT